MRQTGTPAERKVFRDMDKKKALSEAEKLKQATLEKTAKLRAQRLEKEAAERAEAEANPGSPEKKRKR